MNEIWKDIPNYEDYYMVSNMGNVMAKKRVVYRQNRYGEKYVHRVTEPYYKKLTLDDHGYLRCTLSKNSTNKCFKVHRLVMIAFLGNKKLDINHINGIKTDNRFENLEYCSRLQNILHARDNNLLNPVRGKKHPCFKYNKTFVKNIFDMYKRGEKIRDIETKNNISKNYLYQLFKKHNL